MKLNEAFSYADQSLRVVPLISVKKVNSMSIDEEGE